MAILKKDKIKSCCGNSKTLLTINFILSKEHFQLFRDNNFNVLKAYEDAGMLYADSINIVITATIGQNILTVKCKNKQCDEHLLKIESILNSIDK